MKKRLLSGITALLMAAAHSGFTASAQDADGISVEIDRVTLTMDELAALNYTVPIYVRLTENAGFDAAEFGVQVDERCTVDEDIKWLDYDDGYAVANEQLVWRVLANFDNWNGTGTILKLNVRLPQETAVGDSFGITYCGQAYKSHVWNSSRTGVNYVEQDAVEWTDGLIEVIEVPENTGFSLGEDDWSFQNHAGSFGTGHYCIKRNYYYKLIDGMSIDDKEQVDSLLFNDWGGACYGMAVTALLAHNGIIVPAQWQVGAHSLHDIAGPPSEEIQSLIHYYQALQRTEMIYKLYSSAVFLQSEEEKLRSLMECLADGSPALLSYTDFEWGGHAVVAYDIVNGDYTYDGRDYDSKVLVYDSNIDGHSDEYCLYFDSASWEWVLPAYGLNSERSYLGIITDDIGLLNHRGYLDGTEVITPDPYISVLTASPIQAEYTLAKAGMELLAPDEYKAYAPLAGNHAEHDVCFALPDSAVGYVMELAEPDDLTLSMDYENCLLKLEADAAVQAAFDPSGKIGMQGTETDYTLKVICREGIVTDLGYIQIEGNASDASVERTEEGYLLHSDDLTRVSIRTRGGESEEILGFTADEDTVLLHRTQDGMLAASVDADGDGSYETPLVRSADMCSGDLTLDRELTITDVIALNQNLLCGMKLNTAQTALADYNSDGIPDSSDSLELLRRIIEE